MPPNDSKALAKLLIRILHPIARLCLRRGVLINDFEEAARRAFAAAATEEIKKVSSKVNASRISLLTGIYRRDVTRILAEKSEIPKRSAGLVERVIAQWEQNPLYITHLKDPRVLSVDGPNSEFHQLVKSVNKHINPAAVLFELTRTNAVELTLRGVRLLRATAILSAEDDRGLDLLARDMESLFAAVEDNLSAQDPLGHLHMRTEFDNIYLKDLPRIRQWLMAQGRRLHRQAREYLARYDRDFSPKPRPDQPAGGRISLSAFSYFAHPESASEHSVGTPQELGAMRKKRKRRGEGAVDA